MTESKELELQKLMFDVSMNCWDTDHKDNLEYDLWTFVQEAKKISFREGVAYGKEGKQVSNWALRKLHELSEEVNGWWMYSLDGAIFIGMSDWIVHYTETVVKE